MARMLILISALFLGALTHAEELANDQFRYEGICKRFVEKGAEGKAEDDPYYMLMVDLETVDNMVRLVNNPEESADLRYQAMDTSQRYWPTIKWDLDQIALKDKDFSAKVIMACGLKNLDQPLDYKYEVLEAIINGMDSTGATEE